MHSPRRYGVLDCPLARAMTPREMGSAHMPRPDTEKFRLRAFVERLVQQGACVVHDEPIDLVDVAGVLDGNPKAVWFRNVGPERTELVGNVMGARERYYRRRDLYW